jgi:ketosteroid isomerase-like protein
MSQENVELMRAWTDAFNAHDIEAMIALCDPDIDFHSTFAAIGGADYHGHDGVRSWHRDIEETWGAEIRAELEAFFDLGDDILTFTVLRGEGKSQRRAGRAPGGHRHQGPGRTDRLPQGIRPPRRRAERSGHIRAGA